MKPSMLVAIESDTLVSYSSRRNSPKVAKDSEAVPSVHHAAVQCHSLLAFISVTAHTFTFGRMTRMDFRLLAVCGLAFLSVTSQRLRIALARASVHTSSIFCQLDRVSKRSRSAALFNASRQSVGSGANGSRHRSTISTTTDISRRSSDVVSTRKSVGRHSGSAPSTVSIRRAIPWKSTTPRIPELVTGAPRSPSHTSWAQHPARRTPTDRQSSPQGARPPTRSPCVRVVVASSETTIQGGRRRLR